MKRYIGQGSECRSFCRHGTGVHHNLVCGQPHQPVSLSHLLLHEFLWNLICSPNSLPGGQRMGLKLPTF